MNRTKTTGFLILACFGLLFSGCLVIENPYSQVAPGIWRGVLELEPNFITPNKKGEPLPEKLNIQFDEVSQGELPFLFEVVYDQPESFHIEIINGEERINIPAEHISVGRRNEDLKDTIRIDFPIYQSYIVALFEEDVMEGEWVVPARGDYAIPFVARFGRDYRFTNLRKEPLTDISGRWAAQFELDSDAPFPAIGEFKQSGNQLTGTFLTETGDYRFLEGTVQANKLYLSTFDGSHAYLFEGKILEDTSIIGTFRSGKHYRTTWKAQFDPSVQLKNADSLTFLKSPDIPFDIAFKNPEGELIQLSDPAFQGKVRIVQILGTWCPNCRDEVQFLTDYLADHPEQDVKIIGLAFEKYREPEKANLQIQRYRKELKIPYPILYAGYYDKKEAAEKLPMLNQIVSYPTMILVDKQGKVRKIHTGFSGPATSAYADFKQEFEQQVTQLLQE